MKIVLITTTIHIPDVLIRYRQIDQGVTFIITGDKKTPHVKVRALVEGLGNAIYYSDTDQDKLGYSCSKIIGWNKIMRRNIALLEAIKLKPDIIISIDDDNLPLGDDYFKSFSSFFANPFSGVMVNNDTRWFNIGCLLDPQIFHRGFPYEQRHSSHIFRLESVMNKRIGIASGLWLGDPDIDAVDRIVRHPTVLHISDLLYTGVIVNNTHFAPINSQNTAFTYEIAPLMMVLIGVGRFDDIWASYIAERIMMETDYYVHYGRPFVWQERNKHNQWKNLHDELFGMEWTQKFCQYLLSIELGGGSIFEKLRYLYEKLRYLDYLPDKVKKLGIAWCNDLERIL